MFKLKKIYTIVHICDAQQCCRDLRLHSLCITWGGGRVFGRDTKIFRTNWGGVGNFQLIYRGMSNFPLILINSVGLHYKLICHLPEIKYKGRKLMMRQLCTMPTISKVRLYKLSDNFPFL